MKNLFVGKFKKGVLAALALAGTAIGIGGGAARAESTRAPGFFGAGVMLGEPSGLAFRLEPSNANSVHAGLAYSFTKYLQLHGDYVFNFRDPSFLNDEARRLIHLYAGAGASLLMSDKDPGLALRVPLGAEWTPKNAPMTVFLEFAPGVRLFPDTTAIFQGAIGAAYYFK